MNQAFKYNYYILFQPKKVAGFLALTLMLTLALYFYLINSTFLAVSNRRVVEENLATASASLTKLSAAYLEAQAGVTKDKALALGYIESAFPAEIITIDHITGDKLSFRR